MSKVKVFVYGRRQRRRRRHRRRGYDNSSPDFRHGELKAIHSLKIGGGGTKPTGTSYNFDKVWSGAPDDRLVK